MENLLTPSAAPSSPSAMPRQLRGLPLRLRRRFGLVLESLLIRHGLTRKLLNLLRERRPILVTPWGAIVTRYDDVCEVLRNSEVFQVNYYKAGPDQIIAMKDGDEYKRDLKQLEHARDLALPNVRHAVRACAGLLITEACRSGQLDVVAGYSRLIAMRLIDEFLGLRTDPRRMMQLTRAVFRHVFANFTDDPLIAEDASLARSEMDLCIRQQVSRRAVSDPSDRRGMMYSLLGDAGALPSDRTREPLDNIGRSVLEIRVSNFLGGLACAMAETISTAIAYTVDFLLDHPDLLNHAREAAHMIDFDTANSDGTSTN